jgi:hypothetical protein
MTSLQIETIMNLPALGIVCGVETVELPKDDLDALCDMALQSLTPAKEPSGELGKVAEELFTAQLGWTEKWNVQGCECYRYTPTAEARLQAARAAYRAQVTKEGV